MATNNSTFSVLGSLDTSLFESQLTNGFNRAASKIQPIKIRAQVDSSGMGQISADFKRIDKSIESATSRVAAFSATLGVLAGAKFILQGIVTEMVSVEKALLDINVILNASQGNLAKFSNNLFEVAKNTGQSFGAVAAAATELSRQGLTAEQTLGRVNDALILSRLSGLDAAKSVEALTAAINSFADAGLRSADVVNKYAAVDAAFAVSSRDLAEAVSRAGASAQDAGASFNQLLALVTSVQQQTARGGSVIGNALKSIFSRIQRAEVIDQLQDLGVAIDSTQGAEAKLKAVGDALQNLSGPSAQKLKELLGGVYQVNIVSTALKDISRGVSLYSQALSTAEGATDEAIRRNALLNESYSALGNSVTESARKLAANAGNGIFDDKGKGILKGFDTILSGLGDNVFAKLEGNEGVYETIGKTIGGGLLKGVGNVLTGGGAVLLAKAFGNIIVRTGRDLKIGVEALSGINKSLVEQEERQKKINDALSTASQEKLKQLALTEDTGEKEKIINQILQDRLTINAALTKGYETQQIILAGAFGGSGHGGGSASSRGVAGASSRFGGGGSIGGGAGYAAGGLVDTRFDDRTSGLRKFEGISLSSKISQGAGLGDVSAYSANIPDLVQSERDSYKLKGLISKLFAAIDGKINLKAKEAEGLIAQIEALSLGSTAGIVREFVRAGESSVVRQNRLDRTKSFSGIAGGISQRAFGGGFGQEFSQYEGAAAGQVGNEQGAAARADVFTQHQYEQSIIKKRSAARRAKELQDLNESIGSGAFAGKELSFNQMGLIRDAAEQNYLRAQGVDTSSVRGRKTLQSNVGQVIQKEAFEAGSSAVKGYIAAIEASTKAAADAAKTQLEVAKAAKIANTEFGKSLFAAELEKVGGRGLKNVDKAKINAANAARKNGEPLDEDVLRGISQAVREEKNSRTGLTGVKNFLNRNQFAATIGGGLAAGVLQQGAENVGPGGTRTVLKAGGNILDTAATGLSFGGPQGAAIGAAVGALKTLFDVLDDSDDKVNAAAASFEKVKESSTNLANSVQQYLTTQDKLNTAIGNGEKNLGSLFKQLQRDIVESRGAALSTAGGLGVDGSVKADIEKQLGIIFSTVGTGKDADKTRSEAQANLNQILKDATNTAQSNLELAKINQDGALLFGTSLKDLNNSISPDWWTNLLRKTFPEERLSGLASGVAGTISSTKGVDQQDVIRLLSQDIANAVAGNKGPSAGLKAGGISSANASIIEGLDPQQRAKELELIRNKLIETQASGRIAKKSEDTAKALDSLVTQIKVMDAALANAKIVETAQAEAGVRGREFGITRFQKLSSVGASERSQIDISSQADIAKIILDFDKSFDTNTRNLIESFRTTALKRVGQQGEGSRTSREVIDQIFSTGDINKIQGTLLGQAGEDKGEIRDISRLRAAYEANITAAKIERDSRLAVAQEMNKLEQTIAKINRLAASFGGNALTANTGDLGSRLTGSGGPRNTSLASAILEARQLLPQSSGLFAGQRGFVQGQIEKSVVGQGRDVLRDAILEATGGRGNQFSSQLEAGGNISDVIKAIEGSGELSAQVANALEFAKEAIKNAPDIAKAQIDKLSPEDKVAGSIEALKLEFTNLAEKQIKGIGDPLAVGFNDTVLAVQGTTSAVVNLGAIMKEGLDRAFEKRASIESIKEAQAGLEAPGLAAAKAYAGARGVNEGDTEGLKRLLLEISSTNKQDVLAARNLIQFSRGGPGADAAPFIDKGFALNPSVQRLADTSQVINSFVENLKNGPLVKILSNEQYDALKKSLKELDNGAINPLQKSFESLIEATKRLEAAVKPADAVKDTGSRLFGRPSSGIGGGDKTPEQVQNEYNETLAKSLGITSKTSAEKTAEALRAGRISSAAPVAERKFLTSEEMLNKRISESNRGFGVEQQRGFAADAAFAGQNRYQYFGAGKIRTVGYDPGEADLSDSAARLRAKRDYGGGLSKLEQDSLSENKFEKENTAERGLNQAFATSEKLYDQLTNIRNISDQVTNSLANGFGQAFTDAITGAKSFGESMKGVLRSILLELSKQFASAAAAKLIGGVALSVLGGIGGGIAGGNGFGGASGTVSSGPENMGAFTSAGGSISKKYAFGGPVGLSGGGGVPVVLNRGEFVASPDMVSAYGESTFRGMNTNSFVPGGSGTKDDFPTSLADGSYVINRESSMKYQGVLKQMASGGEVNHHAMNSVGAARKKYADGGAVNGGYKPTEFLASNDMTDSGAPTSNGNSNGGVNLTVNFYSDGTSDTSSTGGTEAEKARQKALALQIKAVVQDETRKGGSIDKKTNPR